jgi:GNAT superfamily N-acetyltransferase
MTKLAASSAGWRESLTLAGSTVVTLRPMVPDDAVALVEFHHQLSDRTIHLRYFFPHPVLGAGEIQHLTQMDGRDRLALVVECDGRLVAVGRYEGSPGDTEAEVAFVVADAFQHRGLGTILLRRLATAARSVGITTFSADVLTDNATMLAVFHESGFATTSSWECGVVHLRMAIDLEAKVQAGTHQTSRVPPPSGT